ncbi:MAG: hypothetical protein ACREBA_02150 [Nitrosotalea sp.]
MPEPNGRRQSKTTISLVLVDPKSNTLHWRLLDSTRMTRLPSMVEYDTMVTGTCSPPISI